ncbi:MAG: tRNA uridine-5-carboxymethylaminomethyl(34) synthesis GTPase MnmE [Clostridia bacterium]|nr:tRNA uridine-5-carboxymethylaminomethyl(34) synthesis GTPase MnmE [Clostridia bacterium]
MSTIAAISTAPGIGGIGIIRMSGEDTFKILNKIFKPKNPVNIDEVKGYTIKYGYIVNNNEVIDEVLVSFFRAPNSYTTENLCEISSHGGVYIVRKILEACLENGANLAEPGEFTKRAFLNGRMDLSQAEAVIDVINSVSDKEAKTSIKQLEGVLSRQIKEIRDLLMSVMVNIEVSIDYPEYDVEEVTNKEAYSTLEEAYVKLEKLLKSFDNGKIIRNGIKVAIIGKPNAGKSSLLNSILKEERAIVTDIEGTTRDTIEEAITVSGIPIHIIDTAGIRKANNEVEKIGIEKSRKMAEEADLIIAIFDVSRPFDKEDEEILSLLKGKKSIILLNKIDLETDNETKQKIQEKIGDIELIEISAKESIGIENIYDRISKMFELNEISLEGDAIITNVRHKEIISKALQSTKNAMDAMKGYLPIDIIGVYIKEIMEELGKITGESVSGEIIKEIFSKFCLGK